MKLHRAGLLGTIGTMGAPMQDTLMRIRKCAPARGIFLPVLLGVLLTLSGCPERHQAPASPGEKVIFAYSELPMSALFIVTLEKGFFAAEGIEVVRQRHEFGKLALRSVLDGKADMAIAGDTPIMFAAAAGEAVRVPAVVSTAEKSEGLIARRDRGIAAPRDLRGKRIGVTLGTTGDFFLDSLLTTLGFERTDVTVVNLAPGELAAALREGRVDAVTVWQPYLSLIIGEMGNRAVTFLDETIYSEIMCLATREEIVRTRPETVRKVLRALAKGERFIKEHPDESLRLVAGITGLDKDRLDDIWKDYDFRVSLGQSLLMSLEAQTRWARKAGRVAPSSKPNYLDFIYTDALLAVKPESVSLIR